VSTNHQPPKPKGQSKEILNRIFKDPR